MKISIGSINVGVRLRQSTATSPGLHKVYGSMDYVLGMTSAILVTHEQFSLKTALMGLLKKALYIVVLVVAMLGDYTILHALNNVVGAQIRLNPRLRPPGLLAGGR